MAKSKINLSMAELEKITNLLKTLGNKDPFTITESANCGIGSTITLVVPTNVLGTTIKGDLHITITDYSDW